MPQRNRKSEQIRRANRVIQSRSFILMLVMGVLLFVVLFFKLYQLQIGRHDELDPDAQKLVVINNSGEKQTTKIVCEGNVWSMQLEGYETRIQNICGMENKRQ